ncbi:DNA helicase II [Gracilibacillus boraciitolerans JCM 21714]|uniref:DNA helicase II n=1 Tax=Gracilibacillus boraciitolerans JCM 21714 TaxID=1298598 RepID=W4VEV5_9BACI|nr:endonuclease Q family protein [Gracilibacillus boraciitolerans]GAE91294.1 DNA helicase II [Gracilibacillus boraciitolerans JCM 21714]
MLHDFFVDLHIHVGRNYKGKPVKITASKNLTITNIMEEASQRKGIDIVGVIDCHAPTVLTEIEESIAMDNAFELEEGGIRYSNTTLILGSEIEVYDENCNGPIHVLCYFPYLDNMQQFSNWLSQHMKNIELSSQRYYGSAIDLQKKTKELQGIFIPAHVFTPFKSLFGKGGVSSTLEEIFDPNLIDAIELGLSSDSFMADQIAELHRFSFVTNSDAHSLGKIAREYQQMYLENPTFLELKAALLTQNNRRIKQNFGMNPRLGKYYATVCSQCLSRTSEEGKCSECGSTKYIKGGVADRIQELSSQQSDPPVRPDYIYQVPLEYLPGLGPKTLDRLLQHFGTEMNVIHYVPEQALIEIVGEKLTQLIINLRQGRINLTEGGGGKYGKIRNE